MHESFKITVDLEGSTEKKPYLFALAFLIFIVSSFILSLQNPAGWTHKGHS